MKKKSYFLILFSIIALSCCQSEKNLIAQNAYGYLNSMGNYKFEEAEQYSSKQTNDITIKFFRERIMPHVDSSYIEKNTPAVIKIKGIRMVNDSVAQVGYHKDTPITHQDDTVTMIKRNGKWLAHMVIKMANSSTDTISLKSQAISKMKKKKNIVME